jgi:hypothetical protein
LKAETRRAFERQNSGVAECDARKSRCFFEKIVLTS